MLQVSLSAAECEPSKKRGLLGSSGDRRLSGISWVPIEDVRYHGFVSALHLDGPTLLKQEDWVTANELL